jgi:dihydropyrimidinase
LDLIVRNGTVVTAEGKAEMDVGILEGRVESLVEPGRLRGATEEIDASSLYVLPGLIDAHVHANIPLGEFVTNDKISDTTLAAAHGGTTTIFDFAIPDPGEQPIEAFQRKLAEAEEGACVDYALHGCLTKGDARSLEEIPLLVERGASTIKMFMVYKDRLMLSSGEIRAAMKEIARHGGTALIHAEDPGIIDHLVEKEVAAGATGAQAHLRTHPNSSEVSAMWTVATLVEETGCPTYLVHVSVGEAGNVLRYARDKRLPLMAETCPHYLTLNEESYGGQNARNFVCSPPLRSERDVEALWTMIRDGSIRTVNSDHCAYDTEQKHRFPDDFTKLPNGLPGVETRNLVFFSEGVGSGRISPEEFVALASTNVAKMFGLYPRKGALMVGSDADIVLFDPEEEWKLTAADLHMKTDFTPFEGFTIKGWPKATIVRGKVVVRDGELVDPANHGRFVATGQRVEDARGVEQNV